jgi:hypothetical protein
MLTGDQVFELFNKHGLINAGPIKDGSWSGSAFSRSGSRDLSGAVAQI